MKTHFLFLSVLCVTCAPGSFADDIVPNLPDSTFTNPPQTGGGTITLYPFPDEPGNFLPIKRMPSILQIELYGHRFSGLSILGSDYSISLRKASTQELVYEALLPGNCDAHDLPNGLQGSFLLYIEVPDKIYHAEIDLY